MKTILLLTILMSVACGKDDKGRKGNRGDKTVVYEVEGKAGEKGNKGEPGEKGEQGYTGDQGEKGESVVGPVGARGRDGKPGMNGNNGLDGRDGMSAGVATRLLCAVEIPQPCNPSYKIFYKVESLKNGDLFTSICSGYNVSPSNCSRGYLGERLYNIGDALYSGGSVDNLYYFAKMVSPTMARIQGPALDDYINCVSY